MSSSLHVDDLKKDTLILDKAPTHSLRDSTLTAKKENAINFIEQQRKFCLSWHYNRVNSYLFVKGVELYKFKSKNLEINAAPLSLDNFSKYFLTDNTNKTGLYGYVNGVSVD